jgi:hypothetical protein
MNTVTFALILSTLVSTPNDPGGQRTSTALATGMTSMECQALREELGQSLPVTRVTLSNGTKLALVPGCQGERPATQ